MYQAWCQLVLYSETKGSILHELALIWRDFESGGFDRDKLVQRLNTQVKRLLDLSTEYGFNGNLWQNYLTFLMVDTVHSFGLACERTGAADGTINEIARADFRLFLSLFHFDFAPLEEALGVRTLSRLQDYQAVPKREQLFKGTNILPSFELQTLRSVQTAGGGSDDRFASWFEAYEWMKEEILKRDFDVAILGCGAYGFPLAAAIKAAGKQAIHFGGVTQILFGILGARWDGDEDLRKFVNDSWVRPMDKEKPKNASAVENNCYW